VSKQGSNTGEYRAKTAYKDKAEVETYDAWRFRSWKGRLVDALEKRALGRALAHLPAGARVLDLPCGTGRITRLLLERGYKVIGADVSKEMLASAQGNLVGLSDLESLDEADAEKLPYSDAEFDAVTSIRLMNHVPPGIRVQMLREMARVSRGMVVASYCNPRSLSALKRRIKMRLKPARAPWHPATYAQVAREAAQAGLTVSARYPLLGPISETNVYLLVRKI